MHGDYKGKLHGVPLAVKDNIETKGVKTTCASRLWKDRVSTINATVIDRLRSAGAVLLGKLNMHEFAMGSTSSNSHFGPVRNPWDTRRIPGGSSGGSAAAVAAGLAFGALGTDTRGSIRIPASLCGIVGLKQTFGLVSRFGLIPVSWSLDHVGPMTRSVEDAAIILQALAGYDPLDPTTIRRSAPDYCSALGRDIKGVRLGVPTNFFFDDVDAAVEKAVKEAVRTLKELGASLEEVTIPEVELSPIAGSFISPVEAYAYHEAFLRNRARDYQPNVRERLLGGSVILGSDYVRAQQYRNLLRQQVKKIMRNVDAVITPTTPVLAPLINEKTMNIAGKKHDVLKRMNIFTAPWSLTGQPAISIPCGFTPENLPIGIQIIGRAFDEETVLRVAHSYEMNNPWRGRKPVL